MDAWTFEHRDTNGDGIDDAIIVLSKDYDEPLPGDSDGVRMAQIDYIPSRPDSVARAEQVAKMLVRAREEEADWLLSQFEPMGFEPPPDPDEYGDGDEAWYQMATRR